LKEVDADDDGRASASEMSNFAWEKMRTLVNTDSDLEDWDQDQDGTLNWDELDTGLGFTEDGVDGATLDREKAKFTAADTSGDGVLDASELRRTLPRRSSSTIWPLWTLIMIMRCRRTSSWITCPEVMTTS